MHCSIRRLKIWKQVIVLEVFHKLRANESLKQLGNDGQVRDLHIAICAYTPPAFDASVRGFPSEYRRPIWYGKTKIAWLPEGEKISKIRLFVLT